MMPDLKKMRDWEDLILEYLKWKPASYPSIYIRAVGDMFEDTIEKDSTYVLPQELAAIMEREQVVPITAKRGYSTSP